MAEIKTITLAEIKGLVQARVTEAQSLRIAARALGMSFQNISSLLLHAHRKPGPKLLKALGYRRIEVYVKVKS